MRLVLFLAAPLLAALVSSPLLAQGKTVPLKTRCDRPNAVYKLGETVTFQIENLSDLETSYELTEDGARTIDKGVLMPKEGKLTITGTLKAPGFLRLHVWQGGGRLKRQAYVAAAFEPAKIEGTARMPADFDAFWEAGKKELAKAPVDAKLEHVAKHSDERVTCYQISLGSIAGKRVRGWLSVPAGKGPFPAVLTLPRAGVHGAEPDKGHAYLGALSLNIILHDIPLDEQPLFYHKLSKGDLASWVMSGIDDKDKCLYRAAVLGCLRAVDYLCSRPDFDGKGLALTGADQGGGLAIMTAALDPRVTLVAALAPALCDHGGRAHGRPSGWPNWLAGAEPDRRDKVLETSAYFDAVNFARKFKGASLYGVGFLNTAFPPTTVYAAFNALSGPKTMKVWPRLSYVDETQWTEVRSDFWKANLALRPPG